MREFQISRDGEARVLQRGREQHRARGQGPEQPQPASSGDVGRRDRGTGRNTQPGVRVASQRPLLPVVQGLLLHLALGLDSAFVGALFRLHLRLPFLSAHMVRGPLPPRLENHLRGHKKFSRCVDAGGRAARDGRRWLPVPQYPCIQSEDT